MTYIRLTNLEKDEKGGELVGNRFGVSFHFSQPMKWLIKKTQEEKKDYDHKENNLKQC